MRRARSPRTLLRIAALLLGGATATCTLFVDTHHLSEGGEATLDGASLEDGGGGIPRDDAAPRDGGDWPRRDGALDGSVEPEPAKGCPAAGRTCVAEPPLGWFGPLLVYYGREDNTPSCPASMAIAQIDAHDSFTASPGTCSECKCSTGWSQNCSATITQYASADCSGDVRSTNALKASCLKVTAGSYTIDLTASNGACSPSGGTASRPQVAWGLKVRACGAPSLLRTGCPAGTICAPDSPSPFEARHCITKPGDVDCPATTYTEKLVAVGEVEDTRDCTPCECARPPCTGMAHKFGGSVCAGLGSVRSLPTSCTPEDAGIWMSLDTATVQPSSCAVESGGSPSGTVTAKDVDTICCAP